ncbi:MAG: hypothetical protein ACTSPV_10915, partial [Candidatus Hodarchaeales archaeon]
MEDFIFDLINGILIGLFSGIISVNLSNYLKKKRIKFTNDLNAESYKIRIIKNAKEHRNEMYQDKNAFWYNKSLSTHDLYTYISFLLSLTTINELEILLGIKDRYSGYFRKLNSYRKHMENLKAL